MFTPSVFLLLSLLASDALKDCAFMSYFWIHKRNFSLNYISLRELRNFPFFPVDKTCFERFFEHEDIVGLLDRFVIYHIDAPGQVRNPKGNDC